MRWNAIICSAVLLCPPALTAQVHTAISPGIGEERTVSAGGELMSEARFRGLPGIILKEGIALHWGAAESVDLPAGASLAIIRAKRLKACQRRGTLGWEDCVIDTDDDGRIDRASFNDVGGAKDVVPPVPYDRGTVRVPVNPRLGEGDDFKKVLIYTGASAGTLTISYREFVNDLARPAFTENLSVPLGATFPQQIAVKDHVFEVISISGLGMTYRITR